MARYGGKSSVFRKAAKVRGGPTEDEARAVANLRKTWADADAAKAAAAAAAPLPPEESLVELVEPAALPSKPTLFIARKVGELSSDLAWRHGLFVETARNILPERHHEGIVGATALHALLINGNDISFAAQRLAVPREKAVVRLMGALPSATQIQQGEISGVVHRPFNSDRPGQGLKSFRDLSLLVASPEIRTEVSCLASASRATQPLPKCMIPLVQGEPGRFVTVDQRAAMITAAEEIFMGQTFSFEPALPFTEKL